MSFKISSLTGIFLFVVILGLQFIGIPFAKAYSVEIITIVILLLLFLYFLRSSIASYNMYINSYFMIGMIYLAVSFELYGMNQHVFRQFALFFYSLIAILLVIVHGRSRHALDFSYKLFVTLAVTGTLIELLSALFGIVTGSYFTRSYRYATPTSIIFTYVMYAYLINSKRTWVNIFSVTFLIVYISNIGHDSAKMVLVGVYAGYLMLKYRKIFTFVVLGSLLLIPVSYIVYNYTSFVDANSTWRLTYWTHIIWQSIFDKYIILGNGFGVPYLSGDIARQLILPITGPKNFAAELYNCPPHNSWLAIVFHAGYPALLVVVLPFVIIFRKTVGIIFDNDKDRSDIRFLLLSFIAIAIWASFNVVLELPYGAVCFWYAYALLISKYKYYNKVSPSRPDLIFNKS